MFEDIIKRVFDDVEVSGQWTPLIDILAPDVAFRATIPGGTPISGIFKGKAEVENYLTHILPAVAEFKQNVPMQFISRGRRVVVVGDDSFTVNVTNETHRSPYAMIIDLNEKLEIESILIIQDLSGIYLAYLK
jgi:ketosteroid isomerase-like protein